MLNKSDIFCLMQLTFWRVVYGSRLEALNLSAFLNVKKMDHRLSSATAGVRDFILPTCISFCFFFIYWVVGQVMTHFCKVSTLTRGRKSRHGDHILNHDAKYITVHFHSHPPDRHASFSSFFPNSCIFLVCFFLHYSLLFSFPCPHFSSSFKIITVICLGPETTPNQTAQNKEPELSTYIISKSL